MTFSLHTSEEGQQSVTEHLFKGTSDCMKRKLPTRQNHLDRICLWPPDLQFQNGAVCQWLLSWVKHVSPGRLHSSPFFWRFFPFLSFFRLRFSLKSCSLPSTSCAASLFMEKVGHSWQRTLCWVNTSTSPFYIFLAFLKMGGLEHALLLARLPPHCYDKEFSLGSVRNAALLHLGLTRLF